jgi:hypothetical protein
VILFCSSHRVEHNSENRIKNKYHISDINYFKVFINYIKWIDELNAKINAEVDSLYVKKIDIKNLVGYIYIVRVDQFTTIGSVVFLLVHTWTRLCKKVFLFSKLSHLLFSLNFDKEVTMNNLLELGNGHVTSFFFRTRECATKAYAWSHGPRRRGAYVPETALVLPYATGEACRAAPSSRGREHARTPGPVRVRSVRTQAKRGPVKKGRWKHRSGQRTSQADCRARAHANAHSSGTPSTRWGTSKKAVVRCGCDGRRWGWQLCALASCEAEVADGGVRVYDGWIISAQHRGWAYWTSIQLVVQQQGTVFLMPRRPEQQPRQSVPMCGYSPLAHRPERVNQPVLFPLSRFTPIHALIYLQSVDALDLLCAVPDHNHEPSPLSLLVRDRAINPAYIHNSYTLVQNTVTPIGHPASS